MRSADIFGGQCEKAHAFKPPQSFAALWTPPLVRQERWLLLPQTPHTEGAPPAPPEGSLSSQGVDAGGALVDRGLLVRIAMKEDVLDEGPTANFNSAEAVECSVERAAACARYTHEDIVAHTGHFSTLIQ